MSRRWTAAALLVFLLGAGLPDADAATPWWNNAWRYRMSVLVEDTAALRGVRVVGVRFRIPPGCLDRGADVRVVDDRGADCPSKVLFFQPAVYGYLAFEPKAGRTEYWIYLGNPSAPAGAGDWEPRAGVFLETRRWDTAEGNPKSWKRYRQLLDKSDHAFGAGYRRQIFDGFNPYGTPDGFLSIYTAWFLAPYSGDYVFCTASNDSSYLFVDDTLVCECPGLRDAGRGLRGEFQGKIRLEAGPHRMQYYQAERSGDQAMIAGWKFTTDNQFRVMEPESFLPVRLATPGPLEERGITLTPDFAMTQIEWLQMDGRTYTLYACSENSTCLGGKVVSREWHFSDGTVSDQREFRKLFFADGDYEVKLTVRDDRGGEASAVRPVRVQAIDKLERVDETEIKSRFVNAINGMPLEHLARRDLEAAAALLQDQLLPEKAAELYGRALEAAWTGEKRVPAPVLMELLKLDIPTYRTPERLEEAGRTWLARVPPTEPLRAELLLRLGRIQLKLPGRAQTAFVTFRTAEAALDAAPDRTRLQREILSALGDAARTLRDADAARRYYAQAQALPPPEAVRDYDVSSFALTSESYLRTGRYDDALEVIRKWLTQYPLENLTGYASVLKARALDGKGDSGGAISELEAFLGLEPRGVYLQSALEELADLHLRANRKADALALYQRILGEFQDERVRARIEGKMLRAQ